MTLVAGVDSSTQSTKVEIRDLATGAVVATGQAPHPATTPPRSEQDPAAWWEAFTLAWQRAGSPSVAAISIAAQQHGMVALDADRRVLRPAKLWNDTEAAADIATAIEQLAGGRDEWAHEIGMTPGPAFTIAKLAWLRRCEPEIWDQVAHVVLPHDWLTLQLTGELTTDRGDASGTGYWSAATGDYRTTLLELVDGDRDWSGVMPRVADPLEVVGQWNGALVACGTGDNMAAALGLGLRSGTAAVSIGTSGTAFSISDAPTSDPSGTVAAFADATGRFLPLVCTLNATKVTDAFGRLLGVDHEEFDRLALAASPGASGLTLLPYLDGERTPNLPYATGVLEGVRSDVSREQVARAAVEGVACGLLDALDALRAHAEVIAVVLTGGGARSAAYRHVMSSLCPLPMQWATVAEAVATGACVQAAAVATGSSHLEIIDEWGLASGERVDGHHDSGGEIRERYAATRQRAT